MRLDSASPTRPILAERSPEIAAVNSRCLQSECLIQRHILFMKFVKNEDFPPFLQIRPHFSISLLYAESMKL